jgi:hypothetical protein
VLVCTDSDAEMRGKEVCIEVKEVKSDVGGRVDLKFSLTGINC